MIRAAAMAAVVVALAGCAKPAETASRAGVDFTVERLFTHDGCTVYRFRDLGYARYFTNCSGSASWVESCGKNCSRDTQVSGAGTEVHP